MRIRRTSPPTFSEWFPNTCVCVSMNDTEYGSYGAPRPLLAEFCRTRPPVLEPWPAIPVFATLPEMFSTIFERSMWPTPGAMPLTSVGAAL